MATVSRKNMRVVGQDLRGSTRTGRTACPRHAVAGKLRVRPSGGGGPGDIFFFSHNSTFLATPVARITVEAGVIRDHGVYPWSILAMAM